MIHAFYGNFVVAAVSTMKSYTRWRKCSETTHVLIARATCRAHSTTELKRNQKSPMNCDKMLEGLFSHQAIHPSTVFSSLGKIHLANTPALKLLETY